VLALLPGSAVTAVTLPSPPVVTPSPTPQVSAPPAPTPIGGLINVSNPPGSSADATGGSGAAAIAIPPGSSGSTALAALGDPLDLAPGGDPAPVDQRFDSVQSPNENRGSQAQAREFDRQQYVITAQIFVLDQSTDATDAVFAGGGSGRFGWPEKYRTISQPFGCTSVRQAPTSANCSSGHFHTGDDIAGPDQAEVFAADTGVARVFHGTTGYGNYVIVTHGNGWATLYGHLHDVVVKDGDLVQRGDLLAHEGSTGNSTGPHLHFEVRNNGGYLDPCPFLEECVKPTH